MRKMYTSNGQVAIDKRDAVLFGDDRAYLIFYTLMCHDHKAALSSAHRGSVWLRAYGDHTWVGTAAHVIDVPCLCHKEYGVCGQLC